MATVGVCGNERVRSQFPGAVPSSSAAPLSLWRGDEGRSRLSTAFLPPQTPTVVTETSFVNVSKLSHYGVFKLWN